MTEVEIFWPASLPPDAAFDTEAALRSAGIGAVCRSQALRRGAESYVLLMLATPALHSFLSAVFERLGNEACDKLRECVHRLLGRGQTATAVPKSVVIQSVRTNTGFVFTGELPEEAFRQAIALDPGTEPGRWLWQPQQGTWQLHTDHYEAQSEDRTTT
ncbi:hypothetical protein ACOKM3_07370 [Streptomyces sp. BH106]|uniref:hypothetical protein n=1 Tax=Streptomyces sp. BH106 TaxID=3410409 RepID=UPI003CF75E0E